MKRFLKVVLLATVVVLVIRWYLGRSRRLEPAVSIEPQANGEGETPFAAVDLEEPTEVRDAEAPPGDVEAPADSPEPSAQPVAFDASAQESADDTPESVPAPPEWAAEEEEVRAAALEETWAVPASDAGDSAALSEETAPVVTEEIHSAGAAWEAPVEPPGELQVLGHVAEETPSTASTGEEATVSPLQEAWEKPVALEAETEQVNEALGEGEVPSSATESRSPTELGGAVEEEALSGEWVPVKSVAEAYAAWREAELQSPPAQEVAASSTEPEAPAEDREAWMPTEPAAATERPADTPTARWWERMPGVAEEPAALPETPESIASPEAEAPGQPEPAPASAPLMPWWRASASEEPVDIASDDEPEPASAVESPAGDAVAETAPWWKVAAVEDEETVVREDVQSEASEADVAQEPAAPWWRVPVQEESTVKAATDGAEASAEVMPESAVEPEDQAPWWRFAAAEEAEAVAEAIARDEAASVPLDRRTDDPWARWNSVAGISATTETEQPAEHMTTPAAEVEHIQEEMTAISAAFDDLAVEAAALAEEERWLEETSVAPTDAPAEPVHAVEAVATGDEAAAKGFIDEGNAFYEIEAFELAEHRYSRAVATAPGLADAYYNRANARVRLGDLDGALADFDRAIELAPGDPDALNNRGMLYLSASEAELALKDFESAVGLRANDPTLLVNLGVALTEVRRFAEALRSFEHAAAIDPTDAAARYGAARAAARLAEFDRAIVHARGALDLDPSFRDEMANDPMLETLRDVAAFADLLRPEGARS